MASARRWALGAVLATLPVLGSCPSTDAPAERPNVVFILIDTLRADRMGAYGYPKATSPLFDELAEQGVLFADTTAQSTWTLPSMVSLLTGQYMTAYRDTVPDGAPVLTESFRQAGYTTIGVIGNVSMRQESGFHRGFQWFDNRPARNAQGAPQQRPRSVEEALVDMRAHLDHAASMTDPEDPAPHFIYLHLMDVHHPYDPYPELDEEVPPRVAAPAMPWDWQRNAFDGIGPAPPTEDPGWAAKWAAIERDRGRYDQSIRHTDDHLRRFLDELRGRGLMDHTIVVVASDHGECLWERVHPFGDPAKFGESAPDEFFYRGHGALTHSEGIHTPFLLWGAGVPEGVRVEAPVENVDLFPTLLELCDLPMVQGLHGRSLVGLMNGEPDEREAVYSFSHNASTVRERASGLKLILPNEWETRGEVEPQLYALKEDPREDRNLIDERPEDAQRLKAMLAAWRKRYPTASTFETQLDPAVAEQLRQLGYTEEDIGR